MGEFEEVGNTVKEFASDNATVVIGTVIDQQMDDELRVTVVATGIGSEEHRGKEEPVSLASRKSDTPLDYKTLERPTVIRNRDDQSEQESTIESGTDYLDIPAFLRRQAD